MAAVPLSAASTSASLPAGLIAHAVCAASKIASGVWWRHAATHSGGPGPAGVPAPHPGFQGWPDVIRHDDGPRPAQAGAVANVMHLASSTTSAATVAARRAAGGGVPWPV